MTEVVTSASLTKDILKAGRDLQDAIDEARQASAAYVRVKHEFDLAFHQALLKAEGTDQTRKSIATVETIEQSQAHDEALERKRIAKLQVEAYQSIVSAIQTIGSTARAEMRLGGYPS